MGSMTVKFTRKSTWALLDAVIIIEAHSIGVWDRLLGEIKALVGATIVNDEVFYFDTKKTKKRGATRLRQYIESGKIKEVSAAIEEIRSINEILDPATVLGLDPGELEELAVLHGGRIEDIVFCTADGAVIRALALLGHSESGISFENLLKEVGLQKALEGHYSEEFFRYHLERGKQDRITGTGLRKSPF